ncbi:MULTISPECIES: hypothetical protein [Wolbachia]|nr:MULTISPECIES: hypothetical protein [Wolbachia]MDE5064587.1 hypothetical protein [Wolbachia endosymbiont of Drosophila tristis]MDU8919728.1 hypothetical protein [Wolbachia endosymbiont of Drosophila tristis]
MRYKSNLYQEERCHPNSLFSCHPSAGHWDGSVASQLKKSGGY